MTVTKLGDLPARTGGMADVYNGINTWTVAAGGIPANSMIVIVGAGQSATTTLTDTKANTWQAAHASVNAFGVHMYVCRVTNALVAGDVITSTHTTGASNRIVEIGAWFSPCYFERAVSGSFGDTNATGGTVTPSGPGLVIGVFGVYSTALAQITTPGGGYTDQPGCGATDTGGTYGYNVDWESKATIGGPETPTATLNTAGFVREGWSFAFIENLPSPILMVV